MCDKIIRSIESAQKLAWGTLDSGQVHFSLSDRRSAKLYTNFQIEIQNPA
jgi:hypothetical protein